MELNQILYFLVLPVLSKYFGSYKADSVNLSGDKKIANGYDAPSGEFSYLASYQYKGAHYCGCTIISAYWMLTAAHCIEETERLPDFDIQRLSVVAGITNLYSDARQKQVRTVRKQFRHHGYSRNTLINDVGLIVVWLGFSFTNGVSYIRYSSEPDYSPTIITGWGFLSSNYPEPSQKLQYAVGKRIFNYECQLLIYSLNASVISPITVTNNMTCIIGYYKQNETTCNGDSGGPLLQQLPFFNGFQQVGIISWDIKPCGLPRKPSVSTLIYPYLRWIDCVLYRQNVLQCSSF